MSPPISGESLLPALPAAEPVAPLPPAGGEAEHDFAQVLEEELSPEADPSKISEPSEPAAVPEEAKPPLLLEPWTWFAFAQLAPPAETPASNLTSGSVPSSPEPDSSISPAVPAPPPKAEQKMPPLAQPVESAEELIAPKPLESPQITRGMVAAQGTTVLSSNHKKDSPAAPKEPQTLSGAEMPAAENFALTETLTAEVVAPLARTLSDSGSEREKIPSVDLVTGGPAAAVEAETVSEAQPADEIKAVEVIQKVEQQVRILRLSGLDRMEVMLRPDADTQILIQVMKIDGQIQVQVRCERGDLSFLDSHWTNVQSSLAAQGIRVEPLLHASGTTDFSHSQFSDSEQQREQEDFGAEIDRLGTFLQINPASAVPAGGPVIEQSWQRWA